MLKDEEKIQKIKEAIESFDSADLDSYQTLLVINNIINRRMPSKEDFEWAEQILQELDDYFQGE